MFEEALRARTMETYFPLSEQFNTQSEPAYCAISTLAMCLNAFSIDPNETWKHPWRWYSEEMLECCTPLVKIKKVGLTLEEFVTLARCHGVAVEESRSDKYGVDHFRQVVKAVSSHSTLKGLQSAIVVSYSRTMLKQTGDGHMSPLAGYHEPSDSVLVLDVARFKYPPYWVTVEALWKAMVPPDPITNAARGYCQLSRPPIHQHCDSCNQLGPTAPIAAEAVSAQNPPGSDTGSLYTPLLSGAPPHVAPVSARCAVGQERRRRTRT